MTHQAIARKWRPRRFEEISGQTHVTRTLQNAIRLGRVHHAFLLTGARGVGKTSAARILARALNCESGPAENPCNECSACTEMLAGSFPDLVEIDAASHNSVDNIRDLVEKAQYTPQRGRSKIYIIDEVHMVTKQGFNALLKTLEEPPAHVIFILATTDPQQLLDTVVSRCQRFDFKMIPVRTIYERLKFVAEQEGVQVPDASLKVIAREGGGSMRDAQSLLDQVLSFSGESVSEQEVAEILGFIDRSILYGILDSTLSQDPGGALTALSKVAMFGYDVRTFANQLLEAVRNVALVCQVRDAEKLLDLPDEEIERLGGLARDRDVVLLTQQFDILAQAVDAIARSEQPMLLLEMATVKMASVRPLVPVSTMLGRLEALERRLRRGGAGGGGLPSPDRGEATRGGAPPAPSPRYSSAPPPPPPMPQDHPAEAQAATEAEPAPAEAAPAAPQPEPALAEAAPAAPQPEPALAEAAPAAPQPEPAAEPAAPEANVLDSLFSYRRGSDQAPAAVASAAVESEVASTVEVQPPKAIPVIIERTPAVEVKPASPVATPPPSSELCDASAWRQFVHSLADNHELAPLQALLATGHFLSAAADEITVGFRADLPLRQTERLAETPSFLERSRQQFGERVTLAFTLAPEGSGGRSLSDELQRIRSEHREQGENDARQHPAISRTLDAFPGAGIKSVHVPKLEEIKDVR